jgi:glutathione S-transferase
MKLHFHPLSSYSRKTAVGIALRGDAIELHTLDVFGGELRSPAFQAMSPFGKMPVLESPDGPIYESTSILEYLEERGPRVLLPAGVERLARHFDRIGDLYLLDAIGAFFWKKTPEVQAETEKTMHRAWAVFARQLADGRPFVAGDHITLGDLSAAIAVDYAHTEGIAVPETIAPYAERLYSHPVLQASREAARPFVEATRPRRQPPATP